MSYFFYETEDDQDEEDEIVLVDQKFEEYPTKSRFKVQGLRSASPWSIGLPIDKLECSIQNAYLDIIKNSKHYVYIENQFFISKAGKEIVNNKIIKGLGERVMHAIKKNENYCIFIVLPLLPGFGGNITKKDGQVLRIQIEWHLNTIFKGSKSLIKRIESAQEKEGKPKDWNKYLKIFGLRNHTVMNGKPVSEIVYVHSKLIIADDNVALLGSANINDRSLMGNRDSELAVIIEDEEIEKGILAGSAFNKSPTIKAFRMNCWKSLFGVDTEYEDPLDPKFLADIQKQTDFNEQFYWKVFKFYPHNSLKTLDDIKNLDLTVDEEYYYENRSKVLGFAQNWPVYFLKDETSLLNKFLDIGTTLLPQIIFT